MIIEMRHLRTIQAIESAGSISAAAEMLGLTQSALSHQIKFLEDQTQSRLFVRKTRPMRLTAAGRMVLDAANRALPVLDRLQADLAGLSEGKGGRLHIAVECHACYDWLLPVLDRFRQVWPQVDVDIRPGLAYDVLGALAREEIDLAVSTERHSGMGFSYTPLFDYEARALVPAGHPLADAPWLEAEDFARETLLTYPVPQNKLDIFTALLDEADVMPEAIRQVELTDVIVMLVGSGRGLAVLPDWVIRGMRNGQGVVSKSVGEAGITRRLFSVVRDAELTLPHIAYFNRLVRQDALKLATNR